jgi:hypothetical protein
LDELWTRDGFPNALTPHRHGNIPQLETVGVLFGLAIWHEIVFNLQLSVRDVAHACSARVVLHAGSVSVVVHACSV